MQKYRYKPIEVLNSGLRFERACGRIKKGNVIDFEIVEERLCR